jgi:phospholipase/carboxylesterase
VQSKENTLNPKKQEGPGRPMAANLSISALHEEADMPVTFRLREPVTEKPDVCVILQHGVGGNETNLAALALQLPPNALVMLTRGPLNFGPNQYGWFRVNFGANGPRLDPAEAERAREALLQVVQTTQQRYDISPKRTVLAGFSQGGIMSASVALTEPEKLGGFAILSGRILPEIEPQLASREHLAQLQAFISHGEFDNTLPVFWAERAQTWLEQLGVPLQAQRYPAGHELTAAMQADFLAWLNRIIT